MKIIDEWKLAIENILSKAQKEQLISPDINISSTALFLISVYEGIRMIRTIDNEDTKLDECICCILKYVRSL